MREFGSVSVVHSLVTEHRPGREIRGTVIFGGITGGFLVIGWESQGTRRTTEFDPECWKSNILGSIISLTRTKPNLCVGFVQPDSEVSLYTIELQWG
jgi:hypothetical protein